MFGLRFITLGLALISTAGLAQELALEQKIDIGSVAGRIDHMAVDVARHRLLVAELGNNSLGVIDIAAGRLEKTIDGLKEPQGVGYSPNFDLIYVTNAGDGSVHLLKGADFSSVATIGLGDDADNIRFDGVEKLLVGYGNGAIAVLDARTGRKLSDIWLAAHPEAFVVDAAARRLYVNLPNARQVGAVDLDKGAVASQWSVAGAAANFAMAFEAGGNRLFVAYRNPASIVTIDAGSGRVLSRTETCGDVDDVFFDAKRSRLYASCGEGFVAVFDAMSEPKEIRRIPTRAGARTALFVPELDRLFVGVRSHGGAGAAIWIYRPQ